MKYKLVLATHNQHKFNEMKSILNPFGVELVSLKDLNININNIDENGSSYEENSLIKARFISEHTNLPIIADDSGLEVEAMDNKPGINSARFAESFNGHERAMDYIVSQTINNNNAKFVCVITLLEEGNVHVFKGVANGLISRNKEGSNGFGYDPIFFSLEANKTFSMLTDEEKNIYSHRAKAVNLLVKFLKENKKI